MFYTWIYLSALLEKKETGDELMKYDSFTDIVFNLAKSINCQAYAAAVYVSLRKRGELEKAIKKADFLEKIIGITESG